MQDAIRKSDRWIPWYFVLFFVVLAILEIIFVGIANRTDTGVVVEHAYEKGLQYNKTIKEYATQDNTGWKGEISVWKETLLFHLEDASHTPLTGAAVVAHVVRPTQKGYDFVITLEETDKGIYSAQIYFPLQGQWDIKVSAQWQEQSYQIHKRVIQ